MIRLKDNSKTYLMCPPNYSSGGPELMHQLANKLELLGFHAFMFYYPQSPDPVHLNYIAYETKYVTDLDDDEDNLLIIPEVMVSALNSLGKNLRIRKCIWWLSVDNFFKPLYAGRNYLKSIYLSRVAENLYFNLRVTQHRINYHLAQSYYAMGFLEGKGLQPFYLSDYLNSVFISQSKFVEASNKENIVLYNPKKGLSFTSAIMKRAPHFDWIPLINKSPTEIVGLLARAKVYVDFGTHPGKDRFPREAAILKCCVITGTRGSAAFKRDVGIPSAYKVDDRRKNVDRVIELINSCFFNYDKHLEDFREYRSNILKEETVFFEDAQRIFVRDYS